MIHLRIRHFGEPEWTNLIIDGDLEDQVFQLIGGPLFNASGDFTYHVQRLNEDDEWEDLE